MVTPLCIDQVDVLPAALPHSLHAAEGGGAQFPDFERVGWFNDIIAQLWPYVNAGVSALAREQLDPMLSESKPGWIRSIKLYRWAPAMHSSGVDVSAGHVLVLHPAKAAVWKPPSALLTPAHRAPANGALQVASKRTHTHAQHSAGGALSRRMRRFDLGTKAPQANGVKVYKSEAVKDQARPCAGVRCHACWAGTAWFHSE